MIYYIYIYIYIYNLKVMFCNELLSMDDNVAICVDSSLCLSAEQNTNVMQTINLHMDECRRHWTEAHQQISYYLR